MEQLTNNQLWDIANLLEKQLIEADYPDDMADYVLGRSGESIVEIDDFGICPITKAMDGKNVYYIQVHFMLYNERQGKPFLDHRFKFAIAEQEAKLLLIDDLSKADKDDVIDRQDVIDNFRLEVEDEAERFWNDGGCNHIHEYDKDFWDAYL